MSSTKSGFDSRLWYKPLEIRGVFFFYAGSSTFGFAGMFLAGSTSPQRRLPASTPSSPHHSPVTPASARFLNACDNDPSIEVRIDGSTIRQPSGDARW